MNELLDLIAQYDSYYEMADDNVTWRRGANIDWRIRELAKRLRAEGHAPEIDALMAEHPGLISSPGGVHALV